MRTPSKAVLLAAGPMLLACLFAGAKDNSAADRKPLMSKRGSLLFSDDFAPGPVSRNWRVIHGQWEIADGMLKGVEVKAENHYGAVRHTMNFHDAMFQFSFKLEGARSAAFMLNRKGGHISRVVISATGFTVRRDRPNETSTEQAAELASVKMPIAPGQWYTMLVEVQGDRMLASLDDSHFALGEHEGIDVDKGDFGLPVMGDAAYFRNVRVWEALPDPGWSRERLTR